jgi:transcriptional regulator
MKSRKDVDNAALGQKLDAMIGLMRQLVALQMARGGTTQQVIAKHLRLSKTNVVAMLKGVRLDS